MVFADHRASDREDCRRRDRWPEPLGLPTWPAWLSVNKDLRVRVTEGSGRISHQDGNWKLEIKGNGREVSIGDRSRSGEKMFPCSYVPAKKRQSRLQKEGGTYLIHCLLHALRVSLRCLIASQIQSR